MRPLFRGSVRRRNGPRVKPGVTTELSARRWREWCDDLSPRLLLCAASARHRPFAAGGGDCGGVDRGGGRGRFRVGRRAGGGRRAAEGEGGAIAAGGGIGCAIHPSAG